MAAAGDKGVPGKLASIHRGTGGRTVWWNIHTRPRLIEMDMTDFESPGDVMGSVWWQDGVLTDPVSTT